LSITVNLDKTDAEWSITLVPAMQKTRDSVLLLTNKKSYT